MLAPNDASNRTPRGAASQSDDGCRRKLSTHHPRLEVRYWTGKYWEPLYGARFHEVLNALDLTPNARNNRLPEGSPVD